MTSKKQKRNSNCLDGMRCPECGSYEPFIISVYSYVEMWDEGSETTSDMEWDGDSFCKCVKCGYDALAKQFDEVEYEEKHNEEEDEGEDV